LQFGRAIDYYCRISALIPSDRYGSSHQPPCDTRNTRTEESKKYCSTTATISRDELKKVCELRWLCCCCWPALWRRVLHPRSPADRTPLPEWRRARVRKQNDKHPSRWSLPRPAIRRPLPMTLQRKNRGPLLLHPLY